MCYKKRVETNGTKEKRKSVRVTGDEKKKREQIGFRKKENRKELTGFRLEQPCDNMDNWISEYKVKAVLLPEVSHRNRQKQASRVTLEECGG